MKMFETSTLLSDRVAVVIHGFSTRAGGSSPLRPPAENVGSGAGPAAVRHRFVHLARAGGFSPSSLITVKQVHGAGVLRGTAVTASSEADALWLARADGPAVIGVRTADCLPVLIADTKGQVVAAIHSGWRGTVAGVVPATLMTLEREAGFEPGKLLVAIGPCIEVSAFEVGPDVAALFPPEFVHTEGFARPHVDLVAAVRRQLVDCGVPENAIERVGGCTHRHPDRYFSYRREGAGTGQQLSFIGFA